MNSLIGEPQTGRNRPCCDVCAMLHAAASTHMFCYWLLFLSSHPPHVPYCVLRFSKVAEACCNVWQDLLQPDCV
jgi:hypothetical protein